MRGQPFSRAIAMMAVIAAAMSLPASAQQSALSAIGPYESRGKGKGGGNRRPAGAHTAFRRAALKLRNKKARHV